MKYRLVLEVLFKNQVHARDFMSRECDNWEDLVKSGLELQRIASTRDGAIASKVGSLKLDDTVIYLENVEAIKFRILAGRHDYFYLDMIPVPKN